MKIISYILALVLFVGWAQASTSYTYAANNSYYCPLYGGTCYGFSTSLAPNTVEYVGMSSVGMNQQHPANYDVTISIDSVAYRNSLVNDPTVPFLALARDNSGRSVTVSVNFNAVRECQRTCHWLFHAVGGSVQ